MYLINLDNNFLIEGVSTRFKNLMNKQSGSLKNCFFLSMLDAEVPDELADDLVTSLNRGMVYNTILKLNVLEKARWFDVTIAKRFEDGDAQGYRVRLEEAPEKELYLKKSLFRKIQDGELALQNGFPVRSHFEEENENDQEKIWSNRIK